MAGLEFVPSKLLREDLTTMTGWTPQVALCLPGERRDALEILYRRAPGSLRPRLVSNALAEADRGQIDLSGLWVAKRRGGRVVGALLAQPLAGRAAAIWAPEVDASWGRTSTATSLVRTALEDLRARGFILAQALLDESAPPQGAADLAAGGMPHVTDLVYLERETKSSVPVKTGLPPIDWKAFGPETEADFRAVLQETYEGSLDMPELEDLRSLDDVLSSHRAGGRFRPERWVVGRVHDEPRASAVLLLSDLQDRDAWEVAYLGLTPPARRRGLGRAALAHAVIMARPHVSRIELAVDIRNFPAHQLYRRAGLTPFDHRAVHIATLGCDGEGE